MPDILLALLIGAAILLALNWLLRRAALAEQREEERKRQRYMYSRTYYLRPARRVRQDGVDDETETESERANRRKPRGPSSTGGSANC